MSKCRYCPIAPGARCCAEMDGRYRFHCRPGLAASEVAAIEALSGVAPSPPPADARPPDLGAQLALLERARECPDRRQSSCGCAYATCARDGRDKAVQDCLRCVGGTPWAGSD